jgi:hypothetical protein
MSEEWLVTVAYRMDTYTAEVRVGGKVRFTASSTSGEDQAAKWVVQKYFGERAAKTLRAVKDPGEWPVLGWTHKEYLRARPKRLIFAFRPDGREEEMPLTKTRRHEEEEGGAS